MFETTNQIVICQVWVVSCVVAVSKSQLQGWLTGIDHHNEGFFAHQLIGI
jgi:hypothetical protein